MPLFINGTFSILIRFTEMDFNIEFMTLTWWNRKATSFYLQEKKKEHADKVTIARQVVFKGLIFRLHDSVVPFSKNRPLLCLSFCLMLPSTVYCVVIFIFNGTRNSFSSICVCFFSSFRFVFRRIIWTQPLRPCAQSTVSGQWVNWCKLFYLHWHIHTYGEENVRQMRLLMISQCSKETFQALS